MKVISVKWTEHDLGGVHFRRRTYELDMWYLWPSFCPPEFMGTYSVNLNKILLC